MESQESLHNFAVYSKTSFFARFIFLLHHKEFIYLFILISNNALKEMVQRMLLSFFVYLN